MEVWLSCCNQKSMSKNLPISSSTENIAGIPDSLSEKSNQNKLNQGFASIADLYLSNPEDVMNLKRAANLLCETNYIDHCLSEERFAELLIRLFEKGLSKNLQGDITCHANIALREKYSDLSAMETLSEDTDVDKKMRLIQIMSSDKLLHFTLSFDFNRDLFIENIIKKTRKEIFLNHRNYEDISGIEELLASIAMQNYWNEYIYLNEPNEEDKIKHYLDELENSKHLKSIHWRKVLLLTCYLELPKIGLPFDAHYPKPLRKIKRFQIDNYLDEIKRQKNFKLDPEIYDQVSLSVKSQYEENPYPRWTSIKLKNQLKMSLQEYLRQNFKLSHQDKIFNKKQKTALIAGCGTGKQIYRLYNSVNDVKISAIDLSLTSLAYAERMLSEAGVDEVKLRQKDILNLHSLQEKFDYIECGGVLHHLKNPQQGLENLVNSLNHNGYLMLALYSKKAREILQPTKTFISNNNIKKFSLISIKLREHLAVEANNGNDLAKAMFGQFSDMFSRSMYRDLLFHEQEYEYDLIQIKSMTERASLKFRGIGLNTSEICEIYERIKPVTLIDWHEIESKLENTQLFSGMYHLLFQNSC